MRRIVGGVFVLGALTACPEEQPPAKAAPVVVAPSAIPTEADFAEEVEAEITPENFEAKLQEIEAAIESDKSK
ncbi:MAG: hypothetical protein RMA76_04120 [Deltaproteobacteria bacterium]|jgi:hypothetical protein